jgi:hypothetical protein
MLPFRLFCKKTIQHCNSNLDSFPTTTLTMQCKCKTLAGVRCRNITKNFLPCCWRHTDQNPIVDHELLEDLYIAPSNISKAGRGLFTDSRIRRGTRVGFYSGRRRRQGARGAYVMECGRGANRTTVDAVARNAIASSALRFCNTWRPTSRVKRAFAQDTGRDRLRNNLRITRGAGSPDGCAIFASQDIPAGGELLLAYGRGFHV